MQRVRRKTVPLAAGAALAGLLLAVGPAVAGDVDATEPPLTSTAEAAAAAEPLPDVEGAIGLVLSYGPEIPGVSRYGPSLSPVGYIRYKRLTISGGGGGGFVNRRNDDLASGLGLDLVNKERRRLSLSLRLDRGRRESASPRLLGLGDVPTTVRLRVGGVWQFHDHWRANLGWTVDAFNRGGGNLAELGLGYERRLVRRTVYSASARLTLGGPRYQQTYYGVNEAQALASGYPVYQPGLGLRDLTLAVGLRTDLSKHWAAQAGVSVLQLLGPSARSPIVQEVTGWAGNAGLVWRF